MKKLAVFVVSAMLVLGLAACGAKDNGGTNGNAGNNAGNSNTEQSQGAGNKDNEAVPTVEELIEKSTVASAGLQSYSMDMKMSQNISFGEGDQKQEQNVDMAMKSDFVKEPLNMYQEIEMETPQGSQKIVQYIVQEGIFTQIDGTWMKQPDALKDQLIASLEDSIKPEKQLENFKTIAQDTKITAEGADYVLTAEMSGDSVKDLAKSLLSQGGAGNDQAADMLDAMTIKTIKVVSAMNKETFLPTRSDVTMQAEMEQEGMKITFDMVVTSTIGKYNEVGELKVPQEALDAPSAQ